MKAKEITGIMLILLFIGALTFTIRIKPVKAWTGETITILSGGSVTPEDAPLSSNPPFYDLYTLTDDITSTAPWTGSAMVVQRDNIVIDGAGYTFGGPTDTQIGINLTGTSGVTITNMTIEGFVFSIWLNNSNNNRISGNNMTKDTSVAISLIDSDSNNITENLITALNTSISLFSSHLNRVYGNNITNGGTGVALKYALFNSVIGNNITNNLYGVQLHEEARFNEFSYNNFIDNTQQVYVYFPDAYINYWNGSYPHRGNYWSEQNHFGEWADRFSGPNQDDPSGPDGILDNQPYDIDLPNIDHLPLTHKWTPTRTIVTKGQQEIPVCIDSNTSISAISFSGQTLSFTATGVGTEGYVLIIIEWPPTGIPNIQINGNPPPTTPTVYHNGTHYFIYFEFTLSTHDITISFPTPPVGGVSIPVDKLSLLTPYIGLTILLAVAVAAVVYVKKRKRAIRY